MNLDKFGGWQSYENFAEKCDHGLKDYKDLEND
jgi:hypothetical protein